MKSLIEVKKNENGDWVASAKPFGSECASTRKAALAYLVQHLDYVGRELEALKLEAEKMRKEAEECQAN